MIGQTAVAAQLARRELRFRSSRRSIAIAYHLQGVRHEADVVVFNPKTVEAMSTRAEPKQFPIGIEYVIVNGKVVVDQNVQNETLAGRALRRGRLTT